MTITTEIQETPDTRRRAQKNGQRTPAKPAAQGANPAKARRRPLLWALGTALTIIAILGGYFLWTSGNKTVQVLQVSTDVARGSTIVPGDIKTLSIESGQTTNAFTTSDLSQVVGKIATTDLAAGSLLTPKVVGTQLAIAAGHSIVGIALGPTQMPSFPLAAGDSVRIVDTPVTQGDPPAQTPQNFTGRVFQTRFNTKSGQWIVDLEVPESQAAAIAARAATGRIALVVDSSAGE
jgi:hypothetical protein